MYSELIIWPEKMKDELIYPESARKLVGLALSKSGAIFPPLLFNLDDEMKHHINDCYRVDENTAKSIGYWVGKPPVVHFDGGKGFIRIYMLGESGKKLMSETATLIAGALAKHIGGPYKFAMNEGDCKIEERNTPILYSIRRLVTNKKSENKERFGRIKAVDNVEEMRKIVLKGLYSQASFLDEDANTRLLVKVPSIENLGMEIFDGDCIPISNDEKTRFDGIANMVFSMNLDLEGPWQCGYLRARGFGSIRKFINKKEGSGR